MSDDTETQTAEPAVERTDQRDELRTLGFRMREIQRLLAVRVEQENRRLRAEGLDPVPESRFVVGADEDE